MGGGLFVVVLGTTAAILIGRRKHKRAVMLMNARGVRRLSGYPGGHVSMTDADWLNQPRTRTLRGSRRSQFGCAPPYTPIASRESLPRQQQMTRPQRAVTIERCSDAHQLSWPLPRRLTRSNVPMVHMRGHSLSPVNERSSKKPQGPCSPSNGLDVRAPRHSPTDRNRAQRDVTLPTDAHVDSPRSDISANAALALTPKPLFHEKQRSASYGAIPKHADINMRQSGLYVVDSKDMDNHHARLPRSTSLYAQHATNSPPTQPLPPLPLNVAKLRSFHSIKSSNEQRGSGHSLLSGNTSVLDEGGSKCFSQAETDLTSTCMTSPTGLGSVGLGISGDEGFKWEASEITRTASPVEALKKTNVRPQLQTQNSFRASIQQSLPRSGSSGLSLSLLHQSPFRHPPNTNIPQTKDGSAELGMIKLKVHRGLDGNNFARRGASPSSPLSRNPVLKVHKNVQPKRSSAVLQAVSGNQGSPLHDGVKSRPLSVATSDPSQWETEKQLKPGKPSAMKGRVQGHKRNSCVRISNIPVFIPSPRSLQPHVEEQEEPPKKTGAPTFTFGKSLQNPPQLRPPSRLTFDPQLSPTPKPRSTRLQYNRISTTDESPTFSLLNLHNPSDEDSPSLLATPTRRSSNATRHSGVHPNRRRPIFEAPTTSKYVFTTPEEEFPPSPGSEAKTELNLEPVIPDRLQLFNDTEQPKPSATLYPFPSPPHPPPRGPRALPPTKWRRSQSRSPTRVSKSNISGSWTCTAPSRSRDRRGSRDLRRSVIALRRMNSDAQQALMLRKQSDQGTKDALGHGGGGQGRRDGNSGESGKGHKRYLSLGEEEEDIDDGKKAEGFEILESMGVAVDKEDAQGRDRQRSESSLAFERALGDPKDLGGNSTDDALSGNVFDIACSMEDQKRSEREEIAPMWPLEDAGEDARSLCERSLYDENGFLKDGRTSPERAPCAIFQN